MKRLSLLITLLSLASWQLVNSQTINHWETAVFNSDTWRYLIGSPTLDPNWRSLSFDDGSWSQGPGGFGYGDNDDNTVIPQCTSVFLRIKFNISDTSVFELALLSMDYDDAFVAYLNDVEIGRAGITGTHPAYDQLGTDHEATMYTGGKPESFFIDKSQLKTILLSGDNVLAIQVHNTSTSSSDLSSNAFLSFGIKNTNSYFRPVPSWFNVETSFISSNLPIVIINTDGGAGIPDEPKISANMRIIYRGEGFRNYLSDQNTAEYLDYDGRIGIEIRGSSSQYTPKKQYGLTTRLTDGMTNNNVSLLGLPAENDWILYSMAFDPSFMRNYLGYNLSRMIGEYASRTVYCELFINGDYQGLYLLLEKIKQGNNRVNIVNIDQNDVAFPNVTGGYITKADKTTGGDPVAWTMSSSIGTGDVAYIHEQPKPVAVTGEQNLYIKSQFEKLSTSASNGNISVENGFPSVIDIPSFIDYMIINELSANADAYQFSTYYHKDRNGKLRAGPIWDLDLTFGNDLFLWNFDRSKTNTWQFSNGDNEGARYWKDLFNNQTFKCYFSRRWNDLIKPGHPLNISNIEMLIDNTDALISEALVREDKRWGNLNYTSNERSPIKPWLEQRIPWITTNVGSYSGCSNVETPPLVISKIMYNPDSTFNFPDSKELEFIEILNTGNETINLTGVYFSGTGFVYQFSPQSFIGPNGKKILASNTSLFTAKYKFAPSGEFTRNLANTGESLVLADGFGNIIDSVKYSNLLPWPDADCNGSYLELTDPLSDNNLATNWIASTNTLLAVVDTGNEMLLNLYPSPVRDFLQIEGGRKINTLELYDLQGHMLQIVNVNSETYILDMTSRSPGMYLIRVVTPAGIFVRKIIKD